MAGNSSNSSSAFSSLPPSVPSPLSIPVQYTAPASPQQNAEPDSSLLFYDTPDASSQATLALTPISARSFDAEFGASPRPSSPSLSSEPDALFSSIERKHRKSVRMSKNQNALYKASNSALLKTDFFSERQLTRDANVWHVSALCVSSVIAGSYYGWNTTLCSGMGGTFIAFAIIAFMYFGLCVSISELSSFITFTGSAYAFARSAFNPFFGFIAAQAELIEWIVTPAALVSFFGSSMTSILNIHPDYSILFWIIAYAFCIFLVYKGGNIFWRTLSAMTIFAIVILVIFIFASFSQANFQQYALDVFTPADTSNMTPEQVTTAQWFPTGATGVLKALSSCVWLFLCVEIGPFSSEEAIETEKTVPKATKRSYWTLFVITIFIVIMTASIAPGAAAYCASMLPLSDSLVSVFGPTTDTSAKVLRIIGVLPSLASVPPNLYASSRQIYALSRAGYLPHFLSKVTTRGNTKLHSVPHIALLLASAIGFLLSVLMDRVGANSTDLLTVLSIMGALCSYIIIGMSFIMLRVRAPDFARPYRSPLGVFGAVATIVLALLTLISMFVLQDGITRYALLVALCIVLVSSVYFHLSRKSNLTKSFEEEFALLLNLFQEEKRRRQRHAGSNLGFFSTLFGRK